MSSQQFETEIAGLDRLAYPFAPRKYLDRFTELILMYSMIVVESSRLASSLKAEDQETNI